MSQRDLEPQRFAEPEGEVVDRRIHAVLEEYVQLTGSRLEAVEPGLLQLTLSFAEHRLFAGARRRLLALDLDVLERYPDAELPVIGSPFWESLLGAIRHRGGRRVSSTLPITVTSDAAVPDVEIVEASVALVGRRLETRRIARLTARVSIAAGTAIEEEVIQSDAIDLAAGTPLPHAVLPLLDGPPAPELPADAPAAGVASADRLVPALLQTLEEKVASRVATLQQQASRDLAVELARLDAYFAARRKEVIDASGPNSPAVRTVEREHARQRAEEERRHEVRVSVEPLQLLERTIVTERADWRLTGRSGRTADLAAQRYLSGDGAWGLACEVCRGEPRQLTVCRQGHAAGVECTQICSVCAERFCTTHGHDGCIIDGAPVCDEHGSRCWSCEEVHCTAHTSICTESDHTACSNCVMPCGACGRAICRRHGTESDPESPKGRRLLCSTCVVFCEGATSEPIGRDEAAPCGTCGAFICARHQVACVVDGQPHCSKHLRQSDRTRRYICQKHVASCDHEPHEVVFAADEVHRCVTCGRPSCDRHGGACHADGRWHCRSHLVVLNDLPDALGCEAHHSVCHVDARTFSLGGTKPCDVCGRATCRTHGRRCDWCGGFVCVKDRNGGRCTTCARLEVASDIPDDVIAAIARVSGDARPKERRIGRDATRFVVELDLGWTRRMVITIPHGAAAHSRVMRHSLFGSKEER